MGTPFKMKGNPFTKGTVQGTKGYHTALKKLKLNRDGYEGTTDGRATSSPFQLPGDKKKDAEGNIIWGPKTSKSSTAVSAVDPNVSTITTDSSRTGVSSNTRPSSGKKYAKEDQVCSEAFRIKHGKGGPGSKECKKYEEGKTTKTPHEEKSSTQSCTCAGPDGVVKYEATAGKTCAETKPAACTKKKEKKCECEAYRQGVATGIMITHPCGEPHVNCDDATVKQAPCRCTTADGKNIEYPKNKSGGCDPKPPECAEVPKKEKCMDKPGMVEKQARCSEKTKTSKAGTWDSEKCRCSRKTKTITKIKQGIGDIWKNRPRVRLGTGCGPGKGFSCEKGAY